jgi:hypothetical protein
VYTQYVAAALTPHETPENAGALQALVNLLGNCQLPLTHRAPVNITASPETNQRIYVDELFQENVVTNPYYSTLNVSNPYSVFVDNSVDAPYVDGGFSFWNYGVWWSNFLIVNQQYVNRSRVKNLTIEKIVKDGYQFEDRQVLEDVNVEFSFDPNTCEGTVTVTKYFVKLKVLVDDEDAKGGDEPDTPEDGPNGSQNTPAFPDPVPTGTDLQSGVDPSTTGYPGEFYDSSNDPQKEYPAEGYEPYRISDPIIEPRDPFKDIIIPPPQEEQ